MNQIKACLSAYVAAWWMKLIALGCVITVGALLYISTPSRNTAPAWPTPHMVDWIEIPEVLRGAEVSLGASSIVNPVALQDVVGLHVDAATKVDFDLAEASQVKHVRIEFAPGDYRKLERSELIPRVQAQLEFLLQLPSLEAVEFEGFVPAEALEPLRGNEQIRRVFTGELLIDGGKPINEQQADYLVGIVESMPNVEMWAVPRHAWYLFQRDRVAPLAQHPSLETILSNPASAKTMDAMIKAFPAQSVEAGYILQDRLVSAWIAWAITVLIANLLVIQLADQLTVSSAPLIPRFFAFHRITSLLCLGGLAVACAFGSVRSGVAFAPAALVAAIAVLIPAMMLEYDRRRPVAGSLQLPACLAPAAAMLLPQFIRGAGYRWLWFDRFLAGDVSAMVPLVLIMAIVVMMVVFWRTVEVYGSSLASNGRESAIANSQADMYKVWGQLGQKGGKKKGLQTNGVVVSRELREGNLSSPSTAVGRQSLIREGLICFPARQMILGVAIFAILFPIFNNTTSGLLSDPLNYLKILGMVMIVVLWFRPVVYWNERRARIPNELATLLPREQYIRAVRGLITRHMILPAVLTGLAASFVFVMKTGQWLYVPVAFLVAVGILVAIGSLIELSITFKSLLATGLICFGVGYAILISLISVFMTVIHQEGAWILLALAVATAATGGIRWWATARIRNFEFGRLV